MLKVTPAEVFSSMVAVRGEGPYDFKQDVILLGSDLEVTSVQSAEKLANEIDFMDPMRLDWRVSPDGGTTRLGGAQSENRLYVTLAAPLGNRLESFLHVSCKAAKGEATEALPDEIDFHDPAVLEWQVSPDGEIWLGGAQSRNRTYVTRDVPNTGSRFYTLLHNSCRDADGLTDEAQVIAAIWSDFTDDREVYRVDPTGKTQGAKLTYYGSWSCQYYSTAHLLEHGDGQCGAWAKFFIDEMGAQGINHTNEYVTFYSKDSTNDALGFLVKNWEKNGSGVSGDSFYPLLNIFRWFTPSGNGYFFQFDEFEDRDGLAGQGTNNPASWFNNHQVVMFGGMYYDPSYGKTYSSLSTIDSDAISGHVIYVEPFRIDEPVVGMDLNGNGNATDLQVLVRAALKIQENASTNDLIEEFDEYP